MQFLEFGTLLTLASTSMSIAGLSLAIFELTERIASSHAKTALAQRLYSLDPTSSTRILYDGAREIINRIFGRKHFTWRCFFRSAVFSLASIVVMSILYLLIHGRDEQFETALTNPLVAQLGGLFLWSWIILSIVPDYLNLYKTRIIIDWLNLIDKPAWIYLICLLFVDFVFGLILFQFISSIILTLAILFDVVVLGDDDPIYEDVGLKNLFSISNYDFAPGALLSLVKLDNHGSVLFYAGMVPSIWLWMVVGATILTRFLVKSRSILAFLLWFLDIEKAPFRSVGVVASIFVFGVTLIALSVKKIVALI